MVEDDSTAEITFADGSSRIVQSNLVQIKGEIEAATGPVPLIKLFDENSKEIWINANHIREVRMHEGRGPQVRAKGDLLPPPPGPREGA